MSMSGDEPGQEDWRDRARRLIHDETPAASSLTFSPDGRSLIAGTRTGRIMRWDLARQSVTHDWEAARGERLRTLGIVDQMIAESDSIMDSLTLPAVAAERISVHSVAVSPAGGVMCAGTGDGVRLWSIRGKYITAWTDDRKPKRSVSFHGDGQEVAYVAEGRLLLRELVTGRVICQVPLAADPGYGDHYTVGSDGRSVAVTDAVTDHTQVSIYRDQSEPVVREWRDWRPHMTLQNSEDVSSPHIRAISLGPARGSLAILAFMNDHGVVQRWALGPGEPELLQVARTGCAGHVVRLLAAEQAHVALAKNDEGQSGSGTRGPARPGRCSWTITCHRRA